MVMDILHSARPRFVQSAMPKTEIKIKYIFHPTPQNVAGDVVGMDVKECPGQNPVLFAKGRAIVIQL
jgi:hypothetical protein